MNSNISDQTSSIYLHSTGTYSLCILSREHCCNPWAMKEQPLSNKISEYMAFARLCFRFVSSVLLKSVMISSCGSWPLWAVNVIGIINGRGFGFITGIFTFLTILMPNFWCAETSFSCIKHIKICLNAQIVTSKLHCKLYLIFWSLGCDYTTSLQTLKQQCTPIKINSYYLNAIFCCCSPPC